MNFVIKLLIIVCGIFICDVKSASHHCCTNSILISKTQCKDGSNISMVCESRLYVLDPSRSTLHHFFIGTDNEKDGKKYLEVYAAEYQVYQPYFCTGDMQYSWDRSLTRNVAVVCASNADMYHDVKVDGSEYVQHARSERIKTVIEFIINLTSAVLLLITAGIYYALPSVQTVQDSCYFYFSFIAGLGHSKLTYMLIFQRNGLFSDMCITNMYLLAYLILCMMSWSTVTSYHIWTSTMNFQSANEAELKKRYKICGFGTPFVLLFFAWVHVHLNNTADTTFVLDCWEHQRMVFASYVFFPLILSVSLNFLMFIHAQIRIWKSHSIQSQDRKLAIKILKYRLLMNAKLFFIMGVPWVLLVSFLLIENTIGINYSIAVVIKEFLVWLVLAEGVPIFLILVVFRKRVLKGIGNRWFANSKVFPDKWKTAKDSETEEVTDDETASRSPETKYTVKMNNISHDDKNILDESAIVIL